MKKSLKQDALNFHATGRPGKLEITPTKPLTTQRDLSLAYSPGVAEPCLAIKVSPDKAYDYTAKGNIVAVISNGTAVQYYGSAFHAIIADNVLANMTGSQTVGGGIHFNSMRYGNGVQPNFAVEVRGNLLTYSDGIAIAGGFNQSTWPGNTVPERTLTHGFVVRSNTLHNVYAL